MGIQPKGKTPISRSLRRAADALRYTEEKATIILISDGKETCDPDPCGTAKELEKEGIDFITHVIGFNVDKKTDKQLECIAHATGGEYFSAKDAASLNKAMKVIVKKVEKPKPVVKNTILVPVVRYDMSPSGLNLSGVQLEVSQDGQTIYSGSDEAPKVDAKVAKTHLKAIYNRASIMQTIEKDLVFEPKEKNVVTLLVKSGQVIIDTAEEQGGPKVKSSVHIYPVIDGEPNRSDEIAWCVPTKTKACERILPIGDFFVEATYNGMKTQKQFTLAHKAKKSLHLYFKQTGKVEVSASEKEDGKWIDAGCRAYRVIDGEVDTSDSWYIGPRKKEAGSKQLPVGKYQLKCEYNAFKKEAPFEIKSGETTKVHVVMGSTGKVEVSASEKEDGKWIDAGCRAYRVIDGEVDTSDNWYIGPRKKKAGEKQLPVGKYQLKCEYNDFKKEALFEVKSGEVAKVHVVMGETGKVAVTASEKEGGKWIEANCRAYKVIDGEVDDSDNWYLGTRKKESRVKKLPVGDYMLKCSYKNGKKSVPFTIKGSKTTKVHVVFKPFFIGAKCANGSARVSYEIYSSSGQLIYEKKAPCSKTLKVILDDGKYTVEAAIEDGKGEVQFSVGTGKPNKLILDLTNLNHEEEINADTQEMPVAVKVKKEKPAIENKNSENKPQVDPSKDIDKTLGQLGALLGGVTAAANASDKPLMGLKESLKIAIPSMAEAKGCYKIADSVDIVTKCDAIANEGAQKAQDVMNSITGKEQTKIIPVVHTKWNDEVKKKALLKISKNLDNAKLYLECINKGAKMPQLKECAANNGDFTPKKDELKDLGNLLKMFGNMK
jgi:Ca-activated chloride channel family protein